MLTRAKFIAAIASGAAGTALAAMASGCSFLGIEDPNANKPEQQDTLPAGAVDFESLVIALNLDTSSWTWDQIDNAQSPNNGSLVVGIPVTATNNDDASRVLSPLYCKILDPNGNEQPDITAYYGDDILTKGSIGAGSSESGSIHLLYRGEGTYTLGFDNLLGAKVDLKVDVPSARSTGMRSIPAQLSAADASTAIPAGSSFIVNGMTLTFDTDRDTDGNGERDTYRWAMIDAPDDPAWNGVWCVGAPVTVVNSSTQADAITADIYGKFGPDFQRQGDPAPFFPDDITAVGLIQPGATAQGYMYLTYSGDNTYYIVFDNDGAKVVTSVDLVQYY